MHRYSGNYSETKPQEYEVMGPTFQSIAEDVLHDIYRAEK